MWQCKQCGGTERYETSGACKPCTRRRAQEKRDREWKCRKCGGKERYKDGACKACKREKAREYNKIYYRGERRPLKTSPRCKCGLLLDHPYAQPTHKGRCKWCVLEANDLGFRDLNPVTLLDYEPFVPEYV